MHNQPSQPCCFGQACQKNNSVHSNIHNQHPTILGSQISLQTRNDSKVQHLRQTNNPFTVSTYKCWSSQPKPRRFASSRDPDPAVLAKWSARQSQPAGRWLHSSLTFLTHPTHPAVGPPSLNQQCLPPEPSAAIAMGTVYISLVDCFFNFFIR